MIADAVKSITKPEVIKVEEDQKLEHGEKLNSLSNYILKSEVHDSEYLIFCDGDAFPVSDLDTYLHEKLSSYPLIAIQRKEKFGDCQPHPSFCATTVKFWREIRGDWRKGYAWQNEKKTLTDTGGNLLYQLQKERIMWYPIHRSNRVNYHRILFGMYDDVIYHQGAGFREPIEDTDKYEKGIHELKTHPLSRIIDFIIRTSFTIPLKKLIHPAMRKEQQVIKKTRFLYDYIYREIGKNNNFKNLFLDKKNSTPEIRKYLLQ
jgi:hypothetical protein